MSLRRFFGSFQINAYRDAGKQHKALTEAAELVGASSEKCAASTVRSACQSKRRTKLVRSRACKSHGYAALTATPTRDNFSFAYTPSRRMPSDTRDLLLASVKLYTPTFSI